MAEELSFASAFILLAAVVSVAWVLLLTSRVRRHAFRRHRDVERRVAALHSDATLLRRDVDRLRRDVGDKADYSYIKQRLDGLIELLRGSS